MSGARAMRAWQINLQAQLGGGEIFTAFLSRALQRLDVPTTLFVRHGARYWPSLNLPSGTEIVPVANSGEIAPRLPRERAWLLAHGPLPAGLSADARHLRTAFAH
ncbi:MAG: hypothetical protein HYS35_03715, partial [Betaproteobacteria bacterium]|nr:hypothetical protein [Betaproteobacteria bacterium]